MDAKQSYMDGELSEAIAIMIETVKRQPQDTHKRNFLCELLCVARQWERADQQLDVIAQQMPQAVINVTLYRQLMRAEQLRQQCFYAGDLPKFIGEPTSTLQWHLQALLELRKNNISLASACLKKAEAERLPIQGESNQQKFHNMRDLDDTCASFFEVLTSNGQYYWIAIEQINSITFHSPERPLDLFWRRAHITVENGLAGEVYIPVIYLDTSVADEAACLGRKTDWMSKSSDLITGSGQRMYLIDGEAIPIMELQEVIIHGVTKYDVYTN